MERKKEKIYERKKNETRLKKGRGKEGRKEGSNEGTKEGRKEGRKEAGRKQGRKEGRRKVESGRKQGRKKEERRKEGRKGGKKRWKKIRREEVRKDGNFVCSEMEYNWLNLFLILAQVHQKLLSYLLVFNGVYRLAIQSLMLVFSTPLVN